MDENSIKKIISESYQETNEAFIEHTYNVINKFDEEIKTAFHQYFTANIFPEIEANGWTFKQVYEKLKKEMWGYNIIEVFIQFNTIKKDLEYAQFFDYLGFGKK